jgi:hypothetical protein
MAIQAACAVKHLTIQGSAACEYRFTDWQSVVPRNLYGTSIIAFIVFSPSLCLQNLHLAIIRQTEQTGQAVYQGSHSSRHGSKATLDIALHVNCPRATRRSVSDRSAAQALVVYSRSSTLDSKRNMLDSHMILHTRHVVHDSDTTALHCWMLSGLIDDVRYEDAGHVDLGSPIHPN